MDDWIVGWMTGRWTDPWMGGVIILFGACDSDHSETTSKLVALADSTEK